MMVNTSEIFKGWDSDPAHNTRPIRTRCPFCLQESKRKRRIYKNLQSLSFHITTNHNLDFDLSNAKILIKAISTAISMGMLPSE